MDNFIVLQSIVKLGLKTLRYLPGAAICVGTALIFPSNGQAQNLFETDEYSGNIYEFTPSGVRSTFASGLVEPGTLAFNSAGDLFVSSFNGGTITEITPDGVKSTFASGLNYPVGLAFNSTGDLFVGLAGSIIEIAPDGRQSTFADVLSPNGMAFDSAGDLFVEGVSNFGFPSSANIYEITPAGVVSPFVSGLNYTASGMAFDGAGDLFVEKFGFTGARNGGVYEYTPGGIQSTFVASGLTEPNDGPAFNSTGDLFIPNNGTTANTGFISEITPNGTVSTFASGLDAPVGLAFQGETLPVPEPSAWGLLVIGTVTLFVRRRRS